MHNAIAFIEVLAASGLTTSTIQTYISAIKAKCVEFDINGFSWAHHKLGLMVRSCSRTSTFSPPTKQVLSPLTLTQLINHVATFPQGSIYRALFLLSFHGFLGAPTSFTHPNHLFSHFVISPEATSLYPPRAFRSS